MSKRKVSKIILGVLAISLLVAVPFGTMSCSKTDSKTTNYTDVAKGYLQTGDFEKAKEAATHISAECPKNWMIILADIQMIVDKIGKLLSLAQSYTGSPEQKLAPTDITTIAGAILGDIEDSIREMATLSEPIMTAECKFELSDFKAALDTGSADTSFDTKWGDRWTVTEARVINAASNLILSAFDLIFSHQLEVDLNVFLSGFNGQTVKLDLTKDPIGSIRSIGVILYTAPRLLEWNLKADNKARFAKIAPQLAKMAGQVNDLLGAVLAADSLSNLDNANNILRYKDVNGDKAIDGGDVIGIGCKDSKKSDAACFKDYTVFANVQKDATDKIIAVVGKLKKSLEDASNNLTGTSTIQVSEINSILAAVGEPSTELLPNIAQIDISKLFVNAQPLRRYLPIWYQVDAATQPDPTKGHWEFLLEGEVATTAKTVPPALTFIGDSGHFPTMPVLFDYDGKKQSDRSGINDPTPYPDATTGPYIPADGIWPGMDPTKDRDMSDLTKTSNYRFYLILQDWSLNGVLTVDQNALPAPYGTATLTPSFHKASNFEANLLINWLVQHFDRRLEATNTFGFGDMGTSIMPMQK